MEKKATGRVRRARKGGKKGDPPGFLLFDKSLMENPANRGKTAICEAAGTSCWSRESVRMVPTIASLNWHSLFRDLPEPTA